MLVWGEQGLGDQILFASMIADGARAGRHRDRNETRLVALFGRSFPDVDVVPSRPCTPARIDVHIPLGRLGCYLRSAPKHFPALSKAS